MPDVNFGLPQFSDAKERGWQLPLSLANVSPPRLKVAGRQGNHVLWRLRIEAKHYVSAALTCLCQSTAAYGGRVAHSGFLNKLFNKSCDTLHQTTKSKLSACTLHTNT